MSFPGLARLALIDDRESSLEGWKIIINPHKRVRGRCAPPSRGPRYDLFGEVVGLGRQQAELYGGSSLGLANPVTRFITWLPFLAQLSLGEPLSHHGSFTIYGITMTSSLAYVSVGIK